MNINLETGHGVNYFKRKSRKSLFHTDLYDNNKWNKLGEYLNIHVTSVYDIHANKSNK